METSDIIIRESAKADCDLVMEVEEAAFGQDIEARLTAALLKDSTAKPMLSLLALHRNRAIGHILFTRVYIKNRDEQPLLHILAPMAVIPEYQKEGIGGLLIHKGIKRLRDMGSEMIFVLGHMDYYPKFGFIPDAKKLGYPAPYPIPEEFAGAWMVQSLNPDGFVLDKGQILCAQELNKEEYWRE